MVGVRVFIVLSPCDTYNFCEINFLICSEIYFERNIVQGLFHEPKHIGIYIYQDSIGSSHFKLERTLVYVKCGN